MQVTAVVFAFVLVLALFMWLVDSSLSWLFYEVLLGRGENEIYNPNRTSRPDEGAVNGYRRPRQDVQARQAEGRRGQTSRLRSPARARDTHGRPVRDSR